MVDPEVPPVGPQHLNHLVRGQGLPLYTDVSSARLACGLAYRTVPPSRAGLPPSPCSTRSAWRRSAPLLVVVLPQRPGQPGPRLLRERLADWLGSPVLASSELMTLMWAGIRAYRMKPKNPDPVTDDELRSIQLPALLLTGERSALIRPARACARLMPRAQGST